MIEGAIILAVGVLLGRLLPNRRGSSKTPKSITHSNATCGCSHHLSDHDLTMNNCAGMMHNPNWSSDHYPHATRNPKKIPCACRQYVGPIPAESYFSTPLILGT